MNAAEVLAIHREVWDMPTLAETRPEVIEWLAERWNVAFGLVSEVIITDAKTGRMVLPTTTTDVRVALDLLLSREADA